MPYLWKERIWNAVAILMQGDTDTGQMRKGKANKLSQRIYNQTKATSVQQLAIHFNQCRYCYRFVCDDCYDVADSEGACKECAEKKHEK